MTPPPPPTPVDIEGETVTLVPLTDMEWRAVYESQIASLRADVARLTGALENRDEYWRAEIDRVVAHFCSRMVDGLGDLKQKARTAESDRDAARASLAEERARVRRITDAKMGELSGLQHELSEERQRREAAESAYAACAHAIGVEHVQSMG